MKIALTKPTLTNLNEPQQTLPKSALFDILPVKKDYGHPFEWLDFGPGDALTNIQNTMSAAALVSACTEAVINTSDFPSRMDGAPSIGQHMLTAKAVANSWISPVRSSVFQANVDLGDYAIRFQNYYTTLRSLAGNLTDANKTEFVEDLNQLQEDLARKDIETSNAQKTLAKFNTDLDSFEALDTGNKISMSHIKATRASWPR